MRKLIAIVACFLALIGVCMVANTAKKDERPWFN